MHAINWALLHLAVSNSLPMLSLTSDRVSGNKSFPKVGINMPGNLLNASANRGSDVHNCFFSAFKE